MKMKIKLRDLTDEQYKVWMNQNCNERDDCINCPFVLVQCSSGSYRCWLKHKEMYSDKFLNQKIEIDIGSFMLTKDEKVILNNLSQEWDYIIRQKDERLYLYCNEPIKENDEWTVSHNGGTYVSFFEFDHLFKFIKYDDVKPYSIRKLLRGGK